jgi:HAMP domain-containing protein
MCDLSREQLDDSVKQQAELASVAFERWVDAQRQPLTTLADLSATQDVRSPAFVENLRSTVTTRSNWIDLRIVDAGGRTLVAQPAGQEELPSALTDFLLEEMRRRNSWAVVTDRTRDEVRPVFAIAAPRASGGAVIARVDGVAMHELFRDIELSTRSVIAVFDGQRRILYRRQTRETPVDSQASGAPLFASLGEQRAAVVELESPYDGVRRVYGLAHAGTTEFVVMVGIPSAALYEPAQRQFNRYALFSLLAVVCALAAALLSERGIVPPVRRLRAAAQQLGAGDLKARSPVTGYGEIGELGAAFNLMAGQIAEREERLTELDRLKSEFVSSVSHELRTPLTTIKTLTRVLQGGGQTDDERREYLDTIAAECDRQIALVLNLLDLTRIEAGAYEVRRAVVYPAQLVTGCVAVEQHAAAARGHRLAADLSHHLPPVLTDEGALRRVLCSLIENAIKYTPDGGQISVS